MLVVAVLLIAQGGNAFLPVNFCGRVVVQGVQPGNLCPKVICIRWNREKVMRELVTSENA